ncbi:MAG: hypothetical protein ACE5DZ_00695 [Mariprofundus sp.]
MKILMITLCLVFVSPVWAAAGNMDIPDADSAAAQLFSQRCSGCHSLPHPGRLDWDHWRSMLHVMKRRMAERDISMPDEEWRQIAGYLKSHAR